MKYFIFFHTKSLLQSIYFMLTAHLIPAAKFSVKILELYLNLVKFIFEIVNSYSSHSKNMHVFSNTDLLPNQVIFL